MKRMFAACTIALLVALNACTSHRPFNQEHERLVSVATAAIAEESSVSVDEVKRSDRKTPEGAVITDLEAVYARHSKLFAHVITPPEGLGKEPKVEVQVNTNDVVHTRHKDWEQRVLTKVQLLMEEKKYDQEKPSSLPPAPIPEPKTITKDRKKLPKSSP